MMVLPGVCYDGVVVLPGVCYDGVVVVLPGVCISARCRGGISLRRRSCRSGGIVMDRPWGFRRSEVKPSGSSHTWCCRPGNRSTRDSMDGQYLRQTPAAARVEVCQRVGAWTHVHVFPLVPWCPAGRDS